jgi:hypothetical protein
MCHANKSRDINMSLPARQSLFQPRQPRQPCRHTSHITQPRQQHQPTTSHAATPAMSTRRNQPRQCGYPNRVSTHLPPTTTSTCHNRHDTTTTTTTSLVNAAIPTVSTNTGPPPQPPLPAHDDDKSAGEHRQAVRGHRGLKTRLEPSGVSFFLFLYMFID